jgi:hypothetical protein
MKRGRGINVRLVFGVNMEEKEKKKLEDAKTKDKGNCDRLMANDFVDA